MEGAKCAVDEKTDRCPAVAILVSERAGLNRPVNSAHHLVDQEGGVQIAGSQAHSPQSFSVIRPNDAHASVGACPATAAISMLQVNCGRAKTCQLPFVACNKKNTLHPWKETALIGRFPLPRRRAAPISHSRVSSIGVWRIFRPVEEDRTQGAVPQSVRPQLVVHPDLSRSLPRLLVCCVSWTKIIRSRGLELVEMLI